MKKLKNSKGFTLMEMLIVVAIIAILVAIAIPSFTAQLEKAREAADMANIRSAYSTAMVAFLENNSDEEVTVQSQPMTQKKAGWDTKDIWPSYLGTDPGTIKVGGYVTVTISADGETVTCAYVTGTPANPNQPVDKTATPGG